LGLFKRLYYINPLTKLRSLIQLPLVTRASPTQLRGSDTVAIYFMVRRLAAYELAPRPRTPMAFGIDRLDIAHI
jgi:hypothetical protein